MSSVHKDIFTPSFWSRQCCIISCDDIFINSFISLFDKQSQIETFLRETISQAQNKGDFSFRNIQIYFIYPNQTESLSFYVSISSKIDKSSPKIVFTNIITVLFGYLTSQKPIMSYCLVRYFFAKQLSHLVKLYFSFLFWFSCASIR